MRGKNQSVQNYFKPYTRTLITLTNWSFPQEVMLGGAGAFVIALHDDENKLENRCIVAADINVAEINQPLLYIIAALSTIKPFFYLLLALAL